MDQAAMIKLAIAAGIAFAVTKYVSNPMVKTAAAGVLGVIVAKQVPYVRDALA